jgi:hypothetical protein
LIVVVMPLGRRVMVDDVAEAFGISRHAYADLHMKPGMEDCWLQKQPRHGEASDEFANQTSLRVRCALHRNQKI